MVFLILALLVVFTRVTEGSYEIVSAQFLTRHGARAPYLSIPGLALATWNCSFSVFQYPQTAPVTPVVSLENQLYRKVYIPGRQALPGNCSQGQLTENGAEQLKDTGRWLRSVLGPDFPLEWDADVMYARSTDIDRTYASAENLLSTLFVPSSNATVGKNQKGPSKAEGLTVNTINIWTIEKGFDDLDVDQNAPCPRLVEECGKIVASSAWQNHVESTEELRKQIATALQVPVENIPDIFLVLEVFRARRAQGIPIPGITDEIYRATEAAATWELIEIYNNSLVHQLTSGQIIQEMVDVFQGVINGSSKRLFSLYAAHDTTVAPLALALQLPLSVWPQYASSIFLGLLQDTSTQQYFVQVLHDRKPVTMAGCTDPCPWNQFVQIASKSFVQDRAAACQSRKRAVLFDPVAAFLC